MLKLGSQVTLEKMILEVFNPLLIRDQFFSQDGLLDGNLKPMPLPLLIASMLQSQNKKLTRLSSMLPVLVSLLLLHAEHLHTDSKELLIQKKKMEISGNSRLLPKHTTTKPLLNGLPKKQRCLRRL